MCLHLAGSKKIIFIRRSWRGRMKSLYPIAKVYPYLPSIGILHVKGIFSLQRLSSQQPFGLLMLHATQFSRLPPSACTGTHTCLWNLSPSNHLKRPSCKLSCSPSNDAKESGLYNELVLIRGLAKFGRLEFKEISKYLGCVTLG